MNKRFNMVIVIFLTIILANITPFIVQSADASEGICGENLTWVLDDTGTLYIKGEGKSEIYENAGDEPWYDYRNLIKKIVIEDGPTELYYKFNDCINLTNVEVGSNVTYFTNSNLFDGCNKLVDISVSSSNEKYCSLDGALCDKTGKVLMIVPKGVKGTFVIPDSITSVWYSAFLDCDQINSVTIGSGLETFYSGDTIICENLSEINVVEDNPKYCSIDGVVYSKDQTELISYPKKKAGSFDIPSTVTVIGEEAFYECDNLLAVNLPSSLTTIGDWAFYRCGSLTKVEIPQGTIEVGRNAFCECENLEQVIIPESVTIVGGQGKMYFYGAFSKCDKLESAGPIGGTDNIQFGWSTEIPDNGFSGCSNLREISLPDTITYFGERAFLGCQKITEITCPTNLKKIGNYAFNGCSELQKIIFTGDLPKVLYKTFYSVNATAYYPEGWNSIPTYVDDNGTITWESYSDESFADMNQLSYVCTTTEGDASYNVSANHYGRWSKPIYSNLIENEDGSFTRIEACYNQYYTPDAAGKVTLETYSGTFELLSTVSIDMELPEFGGYFNGENYHFLVFGQNNEEESDSVEIMRIVKYDKSWKRIDSCSVYGANTQYPFEAGSLRMTETEGRLYIHTCHQMYKSSDGLNHQANMTFVVNQYVMKIVQQWYDVMNISYGYVSHSFNQFVKSDGEYLYRLDHGDAYPRAVAITKCPISSITSCTSEKIIDIGGEIGDNSTGVSVGGFELVDNTLITVGNSVEQEAEDWSTSGKRNIFVAVTDTNLSITEIIWLTDYTEDSTIIVRTPQLVKTQNNELYVLWEEYDSTDASIFVRVAKLNVGGNILSDTYKLYGRLSDCQPICTSTGKLIWYVTEGASPVFYQLNVKKLSDYNFDNAININDCEIELENAEYSYQPNTYHKPEVKITYGNYQLKQGIHFSLTYENNCYPGNALVKITGKGIFEGVAQKEFQIVPVDISDYQLKLSMDSVEYDGYSHTPSYSIYNGDTKVYVNGTFESDSPTDAGNYLCSFKANENYGYSGIILAKFVITPKSISDASVMMDGASYDYNWEEIEQAVYQYDGLEKKPVTYVKVGYKVLQEGVDYEAIYKNNVNVGTGTVEMRGIGNYTGTIERSFQIVSVPEPTATPTLEPTVSPKPITTASPEPTVTVSPKPTATANPKPTETASPEPTETASPEPTETVSPKPTVTVAPKPTETASPEPTETASPKPTAAPNPAPTVTAGLVSTVEGSSVPTITKPAAKKSILTDTKNKCKVTVTSSSVTNPTVTYTKSTNQGATSVKVPDTVKINGITYKVTSVAANAFANNKKLTKVTIGKNVTSIGKNAFKNCTKLKTVTIKSTGLKTIGANAFQGDKKLTTITLKSTKLTAKSVSKTALKGTNSKLVIKAPAKKVAAYKKYFKNKGNATVKVKK